MSNLFRVNTHWFVNLDEIFDIGAPKDEPKIILVTKKNGTVERYKTDNPEAVLERLEEFLSYKGSCPSDKTQRLEEFLSHKHSYQPIKDPIDPYIDYGEIKTNIIKKSTEE